MSDPITVDELRPGDHACLTYSDRDERLDIVAAFVADGLDRGDKIICYTEDLSAEQLAAELVSREVTGARDGQLVIAPSRDVGLTGVGAQPVVDVLGAELAVSVEQGYPGLRVSADMCWAVAPTPAVERLAEFETALGSLFTSGKLTAICEYDRDRFDPVTLAFAARSHAKTVAALAYHDDPVLRICRQHRPPGVRIAGELDFTHRDALEQALSEAVRLDRHLYLNLAKLHFVDVACATLIAKTAFSLPPGRTMTIVASPMAASVLRLLGVEDSGAALSGGSSSGGVVSGRGPVGDALSARPGGSFPGGDVRLRLIEADELP
ncbi:MEDS domain-containing protein [Hamadaea sp. NPDC050747]|uniref:MEDS domain-containing protein n=1 Tax=Hamadaea sp. NPDC050747 TaxID=3155789 RepID=UPI003404200A